MNQLKHLERKGFRTLRYCEKESNKTSLKRAIKNKQKQKTQVGKLKF